MNGSFGTGRHSPLLLAVLAVTLGACKACGPSAAEIRTATGRAAVGVVTARDEAVLQADRQSVDNAARAASSGIAEAVSSFDLEGQETFVAACRGWIDRGEAARALDCTDDAASRGFDAIALDFARADALVALERYTEARDVLFSIRDREPLAEGLQDRISSAFAEDPVFLRPVVTIEPGVQITRIRALGGGSTITLKFKLGEDTIAAFKPNQTRRQSNYRAEVAAYRLCPMIRCGFEVPYSFEVRVEQRDFMRLYGIRSLEGQTGYAANFVDLIWTREDGADYLHGVWKDWVPHFTEFPVEYDDVWQPWVSVDGDPALLDASLEDALRPLRGRDRGNYDEILEEAADVTTRDLARQISNMLVFDFLINNWDRFSGAYYGVNCQWADGHFVSIDNGAGFMSRDPSRPRRRLEQVSRFSRRLVAEVRLMDPDRLLPILFPDPTQDEIDNFEAFRERRRELLDYVDRLIEERGEDAVLFFE